MFCENDFGGIQATLDPQLFADTYPAGRRGPRARSQAVGEGIELSARPHNDVAT
ncbi:MAG: hypothetical protein R2838_14310 [Caldilineaceae bacterium]